MLFSQIEFYIFFLVVFVCLRLNRNVSLHKIIILAASYYFYAYWDYRFLVLVGFVTLVDYYIGQKISGINDIFKRKKWLIVSTVSNLGVLGFFKYFNFFLVSFSELLAPLHISFGTLNLILPVGLSFYILKSLSYTVDVYRGTVRPCKSLLDYAIFVGFFPPLFAGPIVRAADFLPQLQKIPTFSWHRIEGGVRLFIIGLFKKVFIADRLGEFVDPFFQNSAAFDTGTTWLAIGAYTLQIYFDFSGYSDMAIGSAKIIGFDIKDNFNFPYLSKNVGEFWRRWHISLSQWIRDYVYIPLGGNRKGTYRVYFNVFFSMVLCGLWHGAAWTFVFWGGVHGVALVCYRVWLKQRTLRNINIFEGVALPQFLSWGTTMIAVMVGWVFFRSTDFNQSFQIIHYMFWITEGVTWIHPFAVFILISTFLFHSFQLCSFGHILRLPQRAWYTPSALLSMIWLVVVFFPKGFKPFIYFQF